MPRVVALTFLYAVAYGAFLQLGTTFRAGLHGASPFWPVAGFGLAILLRSPSRFWPHLVVVGYAVSVALKMSFDGTSLGESMVAQSMGSLESVGAAAILRFRTSFDASLRRTRDFLLLGGVSLFVAAPIAAALGALYLTKHENPSLSFMAVFQTWTLGDSLGILLFAPPILATRTGLPWFAGRRERIEGALFIAAALTVGILGLGGIGSLNPTVAAFLASPVLCFAAFRYGLCGTSYLAVFLSTAAVASAVSAASPGFAMHAAEPSAFASLQVFAFVAVTMVLLAVALEEQRLQGAAHLRVERSLRVAQKFEALGRLSSGVAHDFNNVLSIIMSSAELIPLTREPAQVDKFANDILSAAARGAEIVKQLLLFSRREAKGPARRSVEAIVERESKMLRRLVPPGSRLDVRIVSADLFVFVDDVELGRTLMNLVTNASDASPKAATITLTVSRLTAPDPGFEDERPSTHLHHDLPPGSYACIAVEDRGVGMSRDVLARLFEPFFTTKPEGEGTGLGLASAFGFATRGGGVIVVSSAESRGTTVRILLPIAPEPPA